MMAYTYEYPRPALTVDIVLFTLREENLQVMLIQRAKEPFQGQWALPGGFVGMDEDLEVSARRELGEETSLRQVYLEQLHTFGDPDRDPRGRVVTVAFIAILPSGASPKGEAGSDAARTGWFPVEDLPSLAFDHLDIIRYAIQHLRYQLRSGAHALHFLPGDFSLGDIQQVYTVILGQKLDQGELRDRFLESRMIEEVGVGKLSVQLYRRRRTGNDEAGAPHLIG